MKKSIQTTFFAFVVLTVLLSGCAPASTPVLPTSEPTAIPTLAPTNTPILLPPLTNTPEPTATSQPSPTPVVLPDVINQTFSGASVEYRDSFEYIIDNSVPNGWISDEKFAAWVTKDNQFELKPADTGNWSGTVVYFSKQSIAPNEGVYFAVKFTGDKESFTLGFDAIDKNGQRIPNGTKDFYSVAMQMMNNNLSAHIIQGNFQGDGYFKGNLKFKQDTLYNIALGFDDKENYIIKIWDPNALDNQLTYTRNWKNFPKKYYFISWISSKRNILIDDFTVFKFDSIMLK